MYEPLPLSTETRLHDSCTLPPGATLVCATHNPGKAVEIAALLDDRFTVLSAAELGLPEPEETEADLRRQCGAEGAAGGRGVGERSASPTIPASRCTR